MPTLKKALESIGLGDKQVAVLRVLLERGPLFASAIAKAAKLNRTTTYGVLKELSAKALVSQVKQEGADRWQSITPDLLPSYIEQKRSDLAEAKKEVEDIVPQLKLLRSRGSVLPKVQFFEGIEGVKQAYEDTLENNKGKELRDISGIGAAFQRIDLPYIEYYFSKRTRLGIQTYVVGPDSEWARKSRADDSKYLRVTKLIPAKYDFESEISIYDNKVGIFSYAQENPVAILI